MIEPAVRSLLSIPIYRRSSDKHRKATKAQEARIRKKAYGHWIMLGSSPADAEAAANRSLLSWDEQGFVPWRYNEIVGWVRLYAVLGMQIRGDLYLWSFKRYHCRSPKNFRLIDYGAITIDLACHETSEDVFNAVTQELCELSGQDRLQTYHLDLDELSAIGSSIDWLRVADRTEAP